MKMEGTVPVKRSPLLGEHNMEICQRLLGMSEKEILDLSGKGVI
jgi:crotonobetainyl-CoA:carnitine CoA-transferase CaiB-like acyl-CoA transferase